MTSCKLSTQTRLKTRLKRPTSDNSAMGNGAADPKRIKTAFAIASETASKVFSAVFGAVANGDNASLVDRWICGVNASGEPFATILDREAVTVSVRQLSESITRGDNGGALYPISNDDLEGLATACRKRIDARLEYALKVKQAKRTASLRREIKRSGANRAQMAVVK